MADCYEPLRTNAETTNPVFIPVSEGLGNKKAREMAGYFSATGSPTWTRTRDLRINSPSLYRLSYQGMKRCGHDTVRLSRRVREWAHRTFSRKRPTSVGNVSKVRMIVILLCPVNFKFAPESGLL